MQNALMISGTLIVDAHAICDLFFLSVSWVFIPCVSMYACLPNNGPITDLDSPGSLVVVVELHRVHSFLVVA